MTARNARGIAAVVFGRGRRGDSPSSTGGGGCRMCFTKCESRMSSTSESFDEVCVGALVLGVDIGASVSGLSVGAEAM